MAPKVGNVGNSAIKTMAAFFVAFLFMMVFPLAVSAAPGVTSFSIDRTNIAPNQSIEITITATPQTSFVFATVDGTRSQGTRSSGNNWTIIVNPTRTSTINVFANNTNNEQGAARFSIPVTVTAATATPTTPAAPVNIPTPPADLSGITIASITETPATRAHQVQLTVVTGRDANDVWVHFNRDVGEGRFALGQVSREGTNYRVWVINFSPTPWAAQEVEIGSNRSYNWSGAARRTHTLTLAQPFVAPTNPTIRNVNVNPRNVSTNGNTTFTIRTNRDVEEVWVRTVDGNEYTATLQSSTGTEHTWRVNFVPRRAGNVQVFANTERSEAGAARRNENIRIGGTGTSNQWFGDGNAQIVGTPTASWLTGNTTRIRVTTNRYAENVWVVMPGTGERRSLSRENWSGTGNRTWSGDVWDSLTHVHGTVRIYVSSETGSINNIAADDSRSVTRTGNLVQHHIHGHGIQSVSQTSQSVPAGGIASWTVYTSSDVSSIWLHGTTGAWNDIQFANAFSSHQADGRIRWTVTANVAHGISGHRNVTLQATHVGGHQSTAHVGVNVTFPH